MPSDGRTIQLVHAQPGRTRFRLPWLAGDSASARRIAEELARMEGVIEVRARPRTGSVLVLHLQSLTVDVLGAALQTITGAEVSREPAPSGLEELPAGPAASTVGRSILELFRRADRRVMIDTEGRLNLPTLTAVGFFGLGAVSVFARKPPTPPWFQFLWWGLRIFRDQLIALKLPSAAAALEGHGAAGEPSQ
jgi:hypothetical protein